MQSQIIEKIFEKNNSSLEEIIRIVRNNPVFQDVMSRVKEEFFINDTIHGISHNERVALLACYIGIKEGLNNDELKLVLEAAMYHDIGRGFEGNHGHNSATIVDRNKEYIFPDLSDDETNIIKSLCHGHSNADYRYKEIAELYKLKNIEEFKKLLDIIKDADALDRIRLQRFGQLDEKYLRTETSKRIIDLSKELFQEYLSIQKTSKKEEIKNINITSNYIFDNALRNQLLFDGENYYLVRSLNKTDIENLDSGKGIIPKVDDKDGFTVQDVMAQIRMQHRKTNLISMSDDPNIVLTYDKSNLHRFVLIKISKEELEESKKVFSAGEYLLGVMDYEIEKIAKNAPPKVIEILENVDRANSIEEIVKTINGADRQVSTSLVESTQKYLSKDEQLEQSKKIAKCKVLNYYGLMRGIAYDESGKLIDISGFTQIMRNGYSSSEWLFSGTIAQDKIIDIPQILVDSLALIKQAEYQGKDKELLKRIEQEILSLAILGAKINQDNYKLEYSSHNDLKNDLTIDRAYEITNGKISYRDTNMQMTAIRSLAEMTLNKRKIIKLLQSRFADINVGELLKDTYCVNQEMTTRQNNRGSQIGKNVSFIISDYGYDFKDETSAQILKSVENLTDEQIVSIISRGIDAPEFSELLIKTRKDSERIQIRKSNTVSSKYIAESIVEGYNWKKDGNSLTKKEKELLVNTVLRGVISSNELYKLYNAINSIQIWDNKFTQNDVFAIIINLAIDGKLGNILYSELIKKDKKEIQQILLDNKKSLQSSVLPISIDLLAGRGKRIKELEKTLKEDYKVSKDIMENRDIKNLYFAKRMVEEFCQYKEIDDIEVKSSLFKSLVMLKSLDKKYANYIARLANDIQNQGLSKMETYSFIINTAINGSAVKGEKDFSYPLLLTNTGFCCQKISKQKNIDKEVNDVTIRKALVRYRDSNINKLIEKAENLDQTDVKELIENLTQRYGIKKEFFLNEQNEPIFKPENVYIVSYIVERFCENKKILDEKIRGRLLKRVLGDTYELKVGNTLKFSTFLHNMEVANLSEDEICETIIALRVNGKTDNGYYFRELFGNLDNIWDKIFKNQININSYTDDFTIQKCIAKDLDDDDKKKLIKQLERTDEKLSDEFLESKHVVNIYISKYIAESYCSANNINDSRIKSMLIYAILSNKVFDYDSNILINLVNNLRNLGISNEEVNEIIINSALGQSLIYDNRYYSYSMLLNNSRNITNIINGRDLRDLVGKVNLDLLESKYKNEEVVQFYLFSYETNKIEKIVLTKEAQDNLFSELEQIGISKEFIKEKDIRNVYCAKMIAERYCEKNNIEDNEIISAFIFSILDRKSLNKNTTNHLHTLINNLSKMDLEEEELCGLLINLGITNKSLIGNEGGYSFNALLSNLQDCCKNLVNYYGDLKLEVDDRTITMAIEISKGIKKNGKYKKDNLDEDEIKKLKEELLKLGIDENITNNKSIRNIYTANWIVKKYCDKHDIDDIKIRRMLMKSLIDVDSLNNRAKYDSTTFISTAIDHMKLLGIEEDDICGILLNISGNSLARKTTGVGYIYVLQNPSSIHDVLKKNNVPTEISEISMATFLSESLDEEDISKLYKKMDELDISKDIQEAKSTNNIYIALWILEKYSSVHDINDEEKKKIVEKILKNKSLNKNATMTLSTVLQSFERIEWSQDDIIEMIVECTKYGKIHIAEDKYTYSQLLRTPYKIAESIKGKKIIFSGVKPRFDGKDILKSTMELTVKGKGGAQICDEVQADYQKLLEQKVQQKGSVQYDQN